MTAFIIAVALCLSVLALTISLLSARADTRERVAAAEWRAALSAEVEQAAKDATSLVAMIERESKQRRITKSALMAARDAHAEKLAELEERLDHLPSQEGIAKLVKQHNDMAADLVLVKDAVGTITSGANLRKVTGA